MLGVCLLPLPFSLLIPLLSPFVKHILDIAICHSALQGVLDIDWESGGQRPNIQVNEHHFHMIAEFEEVVHELIQRKSDKCKVS